MLGHRLRFYARKRRSDAIFDFPTVRICFVMTKPSDANVIRANKLCQLNKRAGCSLR